MNFKSISENGIQKITVVLVALILFNFIIPYSTFAAGAADSDPGTSLGNGSGVASSGQNTGSIKSAVEDRS